MSGFLVLGFVIFVAGFLVGMLAIAVIPVESDLTLLGFLFFALGLVVGLLTVGLVLMLRRKKAGEKS